MDDKEKESVIVGCATIAIVFGFLASVAIFAFMYAVGAWIYGWWMKAAVTTAVSALVFGLLAFILRARARPSCAEGPKMVSSC